MSQPAPPPDITSILDQATDAIRQHQLRATELKKELKDVYSRLHQACTRLALIKTNLENELRGIPMEGEERVK